ncbi:MAG: hypothetical protein LBT40_07435 [Deltaproteobacteria bacterium]|nr:hypothetical protein [Deltaproteobacteria bacterium]
MTDDIGPGIPEAARLAFRALGRAGTPGSLAALVDIASHRAAATRQTGEGYAARLRGSLAEAVAVLDVYASVRPLERGFFEGARVFEEIPLLVREWSAFADTRVLTALVLGCGRGWSAVSLAASLAAAGLPERNWKMEVFGLDVSARAVASAETRRYEESDLTGFPYPRGKWFRNEAGTSRRFRENGGTSLAYGFGDIYLPLEDAEEREAARSARLRVLAGGAAGTAPSGTMDGTGPGDGTYRTAPAGAKDGPGQADAASGLASAGAKRGLASAAGTDGTAPKDTEDGPAPAVFRDGPPTPAGSGGLDSIAGAGTVKSGLELPDGMVNLVAEFRGSVDLLLARNLSREAADEVSGILPAVVKELLREGGLCFTGPGEIWVPSPGMSLEERNGVFYFRKGPVKRKVNTFHTPRRGRAASAPAQPAGGAAPDPARYAALVDASAALLPEDPEGAREKALEAVVLASEDMLAWPPAYEALARAEEGLGRLKYARQIRQAMELYSRRA